MLHGIAGSNNNSYLDFRCFKENFFEHTGIEWVVLEVHSISWCWHKTSLQGKVKSSCRDRESSGTRRTHLCQPQLLALSNYLPGFLMATGSRNPQLTAVLERRKTQQRSQPPPNLQEVFEKVKWTWHKRQLKAEKRQLKARFMTAPGEVIELQASGIMILCKEYGSV